MKNGNFSLKSKHQSFGQKSKFYSKMDNLFKNRNFGEISKFRRISYFSANTEILDEYRIFGLIPKFCQKIEFSVKNQTFRTTNNIYCTFRHFPCFFTQFF